MTRHAACSCGQLQLTIAGEPSRIAMCHCLECQRRTGAVISNQARFRRDQVAFAGNTTKWMRKAESGNALTYHFCPTCGSTLSGKTKVFPERQCCHWELRRPEFSGADNRRVGAVTSPVGFVAARRAAKARDEIRSRSLVSSLIATAGGKRRAAALSARHRASRGGLCGFRYAREGSTRRSRSDIGLQARKRANTAV